MVHSVAYPLQESTGVDTMSWRKNSTELTKQQVKVNIIRTAYHALGAALAGTTAMELPSYDEAIGIPTEEAATIALRTQQVLLEETGISKVSDPLSGSYYVEWLTNRFEQEVQKLLDTIDGKGGFVEALKNGFIVSLPRENAVKWRREIDSGERTVIGWNKYTMDEEIKPRPFRVNPEVARIATERVRKYKSERDQAKTDAALNRLLAAAERLQKGEYGVLMPVAEAMIGAAS